MLQVARLGGAQVTIAACYVTPEGVVLGADSTASAMLDGGFHYFNFNQKVFEIGEPGTGTLGLVTWGLGGLGPKSYRTLAAQLADSLDATPPASVAEVVSRWIDAFWTEYSPLITGCQTLNKKLPFDPNANPPDPAARTKAEEEELEQLKRGLVVGFCLGGYVQPSRNPEAYVVTFDPLAGKPAATPIGMSWSFWGAPNMIQRLMFGCDDALKTAFLQSGKWTGTPAELDTLVEQHKLATPYLPIREAVDFVHACIASTIKAMKFSSLAQVCGGPIEIGVITTDRRFRWVRHKDFDAAITDGATINA
jgi:hypothetical protein